ncbi:hypothetical protein J6590_082385 [Homalodisca vitripennis]|nr:hypothetical protein J6590_082385 [Homalodisca vitripennis]
MPDTKRYKAVRCLRHYDSTFSLCDVFTTAVRPDWTFSDLYERNHVTVGDITHHGLLNSFLYDWGPLGLLIIHTILATSHPSRGYTLPNRKASTDTKTMSNRLLTERVLTKPMTQKEVLTLTGE